MSWEVAGNFIKALAKWVKEKSIQRFRQQLRIVP